MATQQVLIPDPDFYSANHRVRLSRLGARQPIVVGLDGTETVRGAAATALALARAWDAPLRVVSALERTADGSARAAEWRRHAARERERRLTLARFADVAAAEAVNCELDIADGSAIARLVDCALSCKAELIVLGLRLNTDRSPMFCDETALRVIRRIPAPVLAVTPDLCALPRRAVVAIDFSPASLAAARAALAVLQPGGALVLAYMRPSFNGAESRQDEIKSGYSNATSFAFERVARELSAPDSIGISSVQLDGSVLQGLSDLADQLGADLVAVGTGRRDLTTLNGAPHPAAALLRQRRRSILAVPEPMLHRLTR